MKEFGILGAEPDPVAGDTGLEFPDGAAPGNGTEMDPAAAEEVQYDEFGNPIPKPPLEGEVDGEVAEPTGDPACSCSHDGAATVTPPTAPITPEDEFDFNL